MKQKINFREKYIFKKENKNRYIVIIIFCIIGLVSFMFLSKRYNAESSTVNERDHYEKISKQSDTEKDLDEEINNYNLEKAKKQIEEINIKVHDILGEEERHYGVYYYDLKTGYKYVLNSNKEFKAASTMKVPIAMMIADKLAKQELKENTLIEYISDDDSDGAGVLQGAISEGDKIEVSKLMKYMIEESDNVATSMLKRHAGNLSEYITKITSINVDNGSNLITPTQICMVLQKLYEDSSDNIYYKKIIQYMKQTTTHDRIDKYIPNNLVAHKIGDYEGYVNDVGIIYVDDPYILVVYTEDVMEQGRENIALISKSIYEIKMSN